MSRHELDTARKCCADFIQSELRGLPAKNFWKLDLGLLETRLKALLVESEPTNNSLPKTGKLELPESGNVVAGNLPHCLPESGNPLISKTTSETTPTNPLPPERWGRKKVSAENMEGRTDVQERIGKLFNRTRATDWTYEENCLLLETLRRENALLELGEIEAYHALNPRFFPQSVVKLLHGWSQVLDRSRVAKHSNGNGDTPPHVRLKVIEARMAEHPCRPESNADAKRKTPEAMQEYRDLKQKRSALQKQITEEV